LIIIPIQVWIKISIQVLKAICIQRNKSKVTKERALKEEEFEINELKKELILKLDDENQIVFSILKSKLNI
jgi:hypothetical protein